MAGKGSTCGHSTRPRVVNVTLCGLRRRDGLCRPAPIDHTRVYGPHAGPDHRSPRWLPGRTFTAITSAILGWARSHASGEGHQIEVVRVPEILGTIGQQDDAFRVERA